MLKTINSEYGSCKDESATGLSRPELNKAVVNVAESVRTGGSPELMNGSNKLYSVTSSGDVLNDEVTPQVSDTQGETKASLGGGFWLLGAAYLLFKFLK